MTSPNTKVEILSDVSIVLGNNSFSDVTTMGEFGVALEAAYDLLLDAEISSGRWRFAAKTVQLSLIGALSVPFAQWTHEYQLPADYLSMQRIYPNVPYEIFADRLYTSSNGSLSAEYFRSNPPVTIWSPAFKSYFTYVIADFLATSTTENAGVMAKIEKGLIKWSALGQFASSSSRPNREISSQPYISARS